MNAIEAVSEAWNAGRYEWQPEFGGTADEWAARAVVRTLAVQGDITDEQIASAFNDAGAVVMPTPAMLAAVRALLAHQAAVHATRVAEIEAKWAGDVESLNAEVERLRIWKGEAREVLASWDATWESMPAELRDDPLILGRRKSEVVAQYVRDLYSENRDLYEFGAQDVVARKAIARAEAAEARVAELELNAQSMTEAYQAASASLARANQAIEAMDTNFDAQEEATEEALDRLRSESDALRVTVERVRALLPFATWVGELGGHFIDADDLRAALADPKEKDA